MALVKRAWMHASQSQGLEEVGADDRHHRFCQRTRRFGAVHAVVRGTAVYLSVSVLGGERDGIMVFGLRYCFVFW